MHCLVRNFTLYSIALGMLAIETNFDVIIVRLRSIQHLVHVTYYPKNRRNTLNVAELNYESV